MQLDSFAAALLLYIARSRPTVGTFIATRMTGRIASINSAAVFVSLLFWGWLRGAWRMVLGILIIVIAKVVSQHVEPLHLVAELLGD